MVGSGPNGLAAAVLLARAGLRVRVLEAEDTAGGGARTAELTLPGFRHDVCSAVHPLAVASPFFSAFDLASRGVRMLTPEISYAHPLDHGVAGVAWTDLDRTCAGLGADGPRWRRLLEPLVADSAALVSMAMSDFRRIPDPRVAARLAGRVLRQPSFRGSMAPAMMAGVAAHAISPIERIVPRATGLLLATLAHSVGWPLPLGGSQAIVDAMVDDVRAHGGEIVCGHRVDCLADVPSTRVLVLNTGPAGFARLFPGRRQWPFRHGAGACKVDFALSGPVPWTVSECASAGTLHLVGDRAEAVAVEKEVARGRHAEQPFVLVTQPGAVDSTRAPAGCQALSVYAHVPHGSTVDVSPAVEARIERYAPGFRDLILAKSVLTAEELGEYNLNYVGGDIAGGALSLGQTLFRPAPRWDPYATGVPGVHLCSASTPPGPGVHGMAGVHVARRVLRDHFGVTVEPLSLLSGVG